jgi:hypothetical protein
VVAGLVCVLARAGEAAGQVTYGPEGLRLGTQDGPVSAVVGLRNQIRFTTPFTGVPDEPGEIAVTRGDDFRVSRSRLRINGHVFSPRLRYQFQADFVEERIRDLSVTWEARPWLRVRAGRWKAEMNRERIESSSAQQLVDRSILDRWFTLGRQQGVQVSGRVGERRAWSGTYYAGALRGVDARGGAALPVWLGRYEWAWAGRQLPGWQGDPGVSKDLHLAVGGTAARTESAYAFYAGSGVGVAMPVLPPGPSDRFRTRQYAADASLKWRGVSMQGEGHRKQVRRTTTGEQQTLAGAYGQGGVLASALWSRLPTRLEFAARIARVDPDVGTQADHILERVTGINWYVQGHRHKVSADVSQLRFATPQGARSTDVRTRVQWEVTF